MIADISQMLVERLQLALCPDQGDQLVVNRTDIGIGTDINSPTPYLVALYLYDIVLMDAMLFGNKQQMKQKAVYNLRYIIVVSGKDSNPDRAINEHRILGKILETFYQQNRVSLEEPILAQDDAPISITMSGVSVEDKIRIRNHLKEYTANLFYDVSPVMIEPEQKPEESMRVLAVGGKQ